MNSKIVTFLALALFGFAVCQARFGTIKLHVFPSSSTYWVAVAPLNDWGQTVAIEAQEGGNSSEWVEMISNSHWGYWMLPSNGTGFELPLSLRLTSRRGAQIELPNILTNISGNEIVDTGMRFPHNHTHHDGGSTAPDNSSAPSDPSASAGSDSGEVPVASSDDEVRLGDGGRGGNDNGHGNHGGHGGGNEPTSAPTNRPTTAPTQKPTTAPTQKPTTAPTQKPTTAPTQKPTTAPTTKPTTAPTTKPTTAPTTKPTTKPTTAPTTKPTTAPTSKPTSAPSSGSGSGSTDLCGVTPTSTEPLKIVVPLYVEPGSSWTELATAAQSGVQVIAIINPNSGPDSSGPDSSYTSGMSQLKSAGVTMVGYVHTSYGSRALSDVEADVSTYASLYTGLSGIFVDETSADASEVSYYTSLYSSITSHSGFSEVILNPGAQPDQGYLNAATSIIVFEDTASNWRGGFSSWVTCAPSAAEKSGYKYKFGAIAYSESSGGVSSLISSMSSAGMGLVYVTDGAAGCCTYNTLASYFSTEASDVKSING